MKKTSIGHTRISKLNNVNSAIRITAVILSFFSLLRFLYYFLLLAPIVFSPLFHRSVFSLRLAHDV